MIGTVNEMTVSGLIRPISSTGTPPGAFGAPPDQVGGRLSPASGGGMEQAVP